jgi:hypothetical protein
MNFSEAYAEPGYENPSKGILFSDWNYFPRDIGDLLERYGFAIEWEDEWTTCDCCYKALRTSPDCYSWQPSFITTKDGCVCFECLSEGDIETLEDNPRKAVNLRDVDLTQYGYREIKCGYESGWHPGQNDDPVKIYDEMVAHGHKRLLFQVDSVGQFDISFCVWEKIPDDDDNEAYLKYEETGDVRLRTVM